ncbi:hypothetical protein ACKWTF_003778 [Chironomus riparius]
MISVLVNAYSSLSNAVETNFANSSLIAQTLDGNTESFQNITEQLNNKAEDLSRRHQEYVKSNDNDIQQLKVKTDVRYYKSQMIIYLKNDNVLKTAHDNSTAIAEKIINDQGLSLGRAYITKAIILSGMKKINNVNKFTNYLYIHFSDSFTSERLIMEMIKKNKQNANSPDVIFSQPTSYDINKLKRICHDLQFDGSVSKVFLGDDSIKVTLNKSNPSDPNEKPKKVHIRNFSNLDKLRKDISSKNCNVPTRTFYNSDYWSQKINTPSSSKRKHVSKVIVNEKRKPDDDIHPHTTNSGTSKKQKINSQSVTNATDNDVMDINESINSSFSSLQDNDN